MLIRTVLTCCAAVLLLALAGAMPAVAQSIAPYTEVARIPLSYDSRRAAQDTRLIIAGDLNADGAADLALTTPGYIYTFLTSSNDTFTMAYSAPEGSHATGLDAGYFNADIHRDLAIGLPEVVRILFGNGSGGFSSSQDTFVGSAGPHSRITDIAAADFDRDGRHDLAVVDTDPLNDLRAHQVGGTTVYHRNSIALLRGVGDGTFIVDPLRPRLSTAAFPVRAHSEDFNSDGRPELLVENAIQSTVYFNQAAGGFAASNFAVSPGGIPLHVDVIATTGGDINGDGRRDLAALSYFPTANTLGGFYRAHLYRNVPHVTLPYVFSAELQDVPLVHAAASLTVADFNGDGRQDLLIGLEAAGNASIALYAGRGDFSFDPPLYINGGFDAGAMTVSDFNLDGKLDIAVVDCTAGAFVVFRHD